MSVEKVLKLSRGDVVALAWSDAARAAAAASRRGKGGAPKMGKDPSVGPGGDKGAASHDRAVKSAKKAEAADTFRKGTKATASSNAVKSEYAAHHQALGSAAALKAQEVGAKHLHSVSTGSLAKGDIHLLGTVQRVSKPTGAWHDVHKVTFKNHTTGKNATVEYTAGMKHTVARAYR